MKYRRKEENLFPSCISEGFEVLEPIADTTIIIKAKQKSLVSQQKSTFSMNY